jgi:uncharacterized MAPEG superfamily protein
MLPVLAWLCIMLRPPLPNLGRLIRAQSNYFETFPIVVAGVAMIGVLGLH